ALPLCVGYAIATGAEASILRAAAMGILLSLALASWRDADFLNVLGFAGLCLLAINPLVARDPGFLLSFAAVWGVAVLAQVVLEALRAVVPLLKADAALPRAGWRRVTASGARALAMLLAVSAGAY